LRIPSYNQLDVRIDKKWFFTRFNLDLYLDIQNLFGSKVQQAPVLDVVRNENGEPMPDASNPGSYDVYFLDVSSGNVLPSIGIVFEY
jgi:hypothetical protein